MALSSSAATRAMLTPGWTTQSPHCLQSSRQAHRSHFLSPIRQPQPDLVKRVTIIPRAVAAPPMPNKKPPVQDVPIHTAPCRRVMRLKTLHSEAPGKNNGEKELPVGRWVDDSLADTWQSCLLYHRSFYDQFMIHVARSSEAIFGKEKGPLSDPKVLLRVDVCKRCAF